ncbi:MAG TPA: ferredoxin [Gemmatimonadetes bacterium]|jgi:ferredoxin|nr:ferredoxin [Gemmatimonadota bacterium]
MLREGKRQRSEVEAWLLSNVDEQVVGGLTVRIDRDLCVGFGDCIDLAEDIFEFDENDIAVFKVKTASEEIDQEALLEACRSCPVDAIVVLDGEGEQVAP